MAKHIDPVFVDHFLPQLERALLDPRYWPRRSRRRGCLAACVSDAITKSASMSGMKMKRRKPACTNPTVTMSVPTPISDGQVAPAQSQIDNRRVDMVDHPVHSGGNSCAAA